jgi:hypothetical protein
VGDAQDRVFVGYVESTVSYACVSGNLAIPDSVTVCGLGRKGHQLRDIAGKTLAHAPAPHGDITCRCDWARLGSVMTETKQVEAAVAEFIESLGWQGRAILRE